MNGQLGIKLRELRIEAKEQIRKVAADLDIDPSVLSKYERGERLPPESFVKKAAKYFSYDENELLALLLSDKFLLKAGNTAVAGRALKIAEKQIKYLVRRKT